MKDGSEEHGRKPRGSGFMYKFVHDSDRSWEKFRKSYPKKVHIRLAVMAHATLRRQRQVNL